MKTTSTQRIVRFGLLKCILWGCLILVAQLVAMPSELLAESCRGTEDPIGCLNKKMKYVSVGTDENGRPLFKIAGANVQILPDGDGTGNLSVGKDNHFNESTAGFVSGHNNTISGYGTTISGGQDNVADGDHVTISGGVGNRIEVEEQQEDTKASAIGGGKNNVTIVSKYDVVIGGTENKSERSEHNTIIGGEGNNIYEGDKTTIIGGRGNRTEDSYSVVVGGFANEATGSTSASAGGQYTKSTADYATAIGGVSVSAITDYSLIAGANYSAAGVSDRASNYATNIGGDVSTATGEYSTICGGHHSNPSGKYSTVVGGYSVHAKGKYSSSTGGSWGSSWDNYTEIDYAFTGGAGIASGAVPPLHWPTAGDPCAGICDDPVQLDQNQNDNIGKDELCIERTASINGGNCSNLDENRTLTINGTQMNCDWQDWNTIPAPVDGGYCIHITAGGFDYDSYYIW
jgi:hypothetical protein